MSTEELTIKPRKSEFFSVVVRLVGFAVVVIALAALKLVATGLMENFADWANR